MIEFLNMMELEECCFTEYVSDEKHTMAKKVRARSEEYLEHKSKETDERFKPVEGLVNQWEYQCEQKRNKLQRKLKFIKFCQKHKMIIWILIIIFISVFSVELFNWFGKKPDSDNKAIDNTSDS